MAIPLLFSLLGGGLAKAGVLGAAGSVLANPLVASAIGSGVGTLVETGDPKKALLGGLGSFAGGKLFGGMMGGAGNAAGATSTNAISGPMTQSLRPMPRPTDLGQAAGAAASPGISGIFDAGMDFAQSGAGIGSTIGGMLPSMMPPKAESSPQQTGPYTAGIEPMQRNVQTPGANFRPGVSPEFDYGVSAPQTREYASRYAPQRLAAGGVVENPYAQNYAQERAEMAGQLPMQMAQGGTVRRMVPGYGPVAMQAGGIAEMGAMAPESAAPQPNEREVISAAISAIQGQHPQPEIALAVFLQQYGEDALRDLVDRVQSGEMGQTAAESEGQLAGPGDGMSDMIPATVEGRSDVLLSDGEYIVPADVVSHLGNGSTDAGARALDEMRDRVRTERTGTAEQAPAVPQERMMPA